MSEKLSERLFVPVMIGACEVLLKKHRGHRLYSFLILGAGKGRRCVIVPQREVFVTPYGWNAEDKATIDKWLAAEKGFRAFMLPTIRPGFRNPVVDCREGKLVLRCGKRKIIPLE